MNFSMGPLPTRWVKLWCELLEGSGADETFRAGLLRGGSVAVVAGFTQGSLWLATPSVGISS